MLVPCNNIPEPRFDVNGCPWKESPHNKPMMVVFSDTDAIEVPAANETEDDNV